MFEMVPRLVMAFIAYFVLIALATFLFGLIDDDTSTHMRWLIRSAAYIALISILADIFHLALDSFRRRRR